MHAFVHAALFPFLVAQDGSCYWCDLVCSQSRPVEELSIFHGGVQEQQRLQSLISYETFASPPMTNLPGPMEGMTDADQSPTMPVRTLCSCGFSCLRTMYMSYPIVGPQATCMDLCTTGLILLKYYACVHTFLFRLDLLPFLCVAKLCLRISVFVFVGQLHDRPPQMLRCTMSEGFAFVYMTILRI